MKLLSKRRFACHRTHSTLAADDVAKAVGRVAVGSPVNGTVEVAGPQQFRFDELIRQGLAARNDPRAVVVDPHARSFGAELAGAFADPCRRRAARRISLQEWLASRCSSSDDYADRCWHSGQELAERCVLGSARLPDAPLDLG